eukprot:CAMPEP_0203924724 /NCGR_PEP_ID=MMETSP0359-20131031/64459_1 /ASSEMBLY_ACC=CAM_ASM_000338 /TAXON_ID=268821 /ORGANISM="Scrippsiella Hangoei, Strain SHTV-5" /LENGTH=154 /DNA_ID=CAMNT_0050853011 /DNA_START=398 /DNA_END=863 /DNA_ORIENTATION=+
MRRHDANGRLGRKALNCHHAIQGHMVDGGSSERVQQGSPEHVGVDFEVEILRRLAPRVAAKALLRSASAMLRTPGLLGVNKPEEALLGRGAVPSAGARRRLFKVRGMPSDVALVAPSWPSSKSGPGDEGREAAEPFERVDAESCSIPILASCVA